ncbi:GNAT family N-acetyltransferase [Cohnella pontilimi]|nr:GNAT family N-acetyltransferase [Cohnella pontilimi]
MNLYSDKESVSVIPLGLDEIKHYMTDLLEIEGLIHQRMGPRYSVEQWNEENFCRRLTAKHECSWGILGSDSNCVRAFLIGSRPSPDLQHIHRIATHPDFTRRGYSSMLLEQALTQWMLHESTRMITAIVNVQNLASIFMFRKSGFEILKGEALNHYLTEKSAVHPSISHDGFEDVHGIRYVVLFRRKADEFYR